MIHFYSLIHVRENTPHAKLSLHVAFYILSRFHMTSGDPDLINIYQSISFLGNCLFYSAAAVRRNGSTIAAAVKKYEGDYDYPQCVVFKEIAEAVHLFVSLPLY